MILYFVVAICFTLSSSLYLEGTGIGASCIRVDDAIMAYLGSNLDGFGPSADLSWTATSCAIECSKHEACVYWNWKAGTGCFLKSDRSSSPTRGFIGGGFIGGDRDCRPEALLSGAWAPYSSLLTRAWANNFGSSNIPSRPPYGQRCSGRNYGERRCCTPQQPCGEGEGDCDGPGDGGQHDGHAGCRGSLVCGSNNCKKFGSYFHEKDDCCEKPYSSSSSGSSSSQWVSSSGSSSSEWGSSSGSPSNGWGSSSGSSSNGWSSNIPSEPPYGQRCSGRNYGERRCCTPQQPCGEGEGDCDGPGDGGQHDGHAGCRGSLVCGSNNCKKFGSYYHEKDDCCERPNGSLAGGSGGSSGSFGGGNWSNWGSWSQCNQRCGGGKRVRQRFCSGSGCNRQQQSQERNCNTQPCFGKLVGSTGYGK